MELFASPPWGSLTIMVVIGSKVKLELFYTKSDIYNTLQKYVLKICTYWRRENILLHKKVKDHCFCPPGEWHISHMSGSFVKKNN